LVVADNLFKSYGKTLYLKDISINLKRGSALAVAGENGAGKTTLLKILATASMPDSGTLLIGGIDAIKNPAGARESIGYVPQGIALMQELSVRDNLFYWMKTKDEALYGWALEAVGLEGMEKKKVAKLSGGMKRRLNLGASLVLRPSLLILDEPLAGVDIANRRKIIGNLFELKKHGVTIIFTSHYIEEMSMLADELIALRDGSVTYYGDMDFSGTEHHSLSEAIRYYTA
jgi:ABC-2 type transport system ATP-binding protein